MAGLDPKKDIKAIFKVANGIDKEQAMNDKTKYVVYILYKLRMDFHVDVMQMLTRKRDAIFNVFGRFKMMNVE